MRAEKLPNPGTYSKRGQSMRIASATYISAAEVASYRNADKKCAEAALGIAMYQAALAAVSSLVRSV